MCVGGGGGMGSKIYVKTEHFILNLLVIINTNFNYSN